MNDNTVYVLWKNPDDPNGKLIPLTPASEIPDCEDVPAYVVCCPRAKAIEIKIALSAITDGQHRLKIMRDLYRPSDN
jgi:hypothetical protein